MRSNKSINKRLIIILAIFCLSLFAIPSIVIADGEEMYIGDADTNEAIQDVAGGMVTGNTETDIAVTYDDSTGKLNFVVDSHDNITGAGTLDTEAEIEAAVDLQDLQGAVTDAQVPDDITITEVDGSTTNEIQDLSLATNTLSLSLSAATVDLSGYLDNTDSQDLSLTGNTLSLTGDATSVDLSGYLDNTDAQDLSLAGNTLSLTGDATSVDLSGYLDNTDAQDLSLAGDTLSLTGDATSVDLSGYYNSEADLTGLLDDNYQPLDADLTSIAALGTAADKFPYTTGIGTWAEGSITAAGRAILNGATSAEMLALISDPTGTGKVVFDTSPTLVTPVLGSASGTKIDLTDIVSDDNAERVLGAFMKPTTTINATAYHYAIYGYNFPLVSTGVTQSGYESGNDFSIFRNSIAADSNDGGTLTALYGIHLLYGHLNTHADEVPLTTNAYGFYAKPYYMTGKITNLYGLYLDNATVGGTAPDAYYGIYQASATPSNYFAGPVTMANTTINMTTSGTTLTVGVGADNGTVSAGVFTDRSKWYEGDALSEIANIKGIDGQIDHNTLPEFVRKQQKLPVYEETPLTELDAKDAIERFEVTDQFDDKGDFIINRIPKANVYVDQRDPLDQNDDRYYEKPESGEIFEDGYGVVKVRIKKGTRIEEQRDLGANISMNTVAIQQLMDKVERLENKVLVQNKGLVGMGTGNSFLIGLIGILLIKRRKRNTKP